MANSIDIKVDGIDTRVHKLLKIHSLYHSEETLYSIKANIDNIAIYSYVNEEMHVCTFPHTDLFA